MAKFELVSRYTDTSLLPTRSTEFSAGYDFKAAEEIIIPPYDFMKEAMRTTAATAKYITLDDVALITRSHKLKPTLVPTGIKCKLDPNTFLQIQLRSSLPLKHWLIQPNAPGIIDADYYNNEANEGEIFVQLINLSPYYIQLQKGDRIAQGIILPYYITEDDCGNGVVRAGGFGST